MASVDPIPQDYPRVTPYLHVDGASAAIDFYTGVFGATERMRMPGDRPESIGHAEIQLGNSVIMLADEFPDMGIVGPKTIGGSPVTIHVYVEDVDAVFAKAVRAGARALEEPTDQFYGDRSGQFEDPFGHRWNVASHVEDVPADEMQRRMADATGG
ncbi:MAG TPA: VOC family protein [Egibacteraceae bacterium]|nr:VOC family protein [Egibacteraceae bacterium]